MPLPGFLRQAVEEVKQMPNILLAAEAGQEGNGGKAEVAQTESMAQPQRKGSPEEELCHVWVARGEEGGNQREGQARPEEEFGWLPCPAQEEEENNGKEDVVRLEQGCLLHSKHPAQGQGQQAGTEQSCCIQTEDACSDAQECPICTEPYDQDQRKPALLNCSHVLCGRCLRSIMEAASAADVGRVRCPICRQKTPMLEWEICKLQEELLLLNSAQAPVSGSPVLNVLPARRPGLLGSLEHHFQVRFHTTRMIGFLPCLRYPHCLIRGLARLEHRCRCCYLLALLALLAAEMLSLLLVFLPIVLLLLLFLILDK